MSMCTRPAHRLLVAPVALVLCVWLGVAAAASVAAQTLQQLEQQAIRDAVERVSPAVVQLQIIGGADRVGDVNLASGPATGVILSADGYVVTSRYRFDPPPSSVVAILADGRQFAAQIVATDFSRKLVLLKLQDAKDLPTVEPAPANSVRVGQWAVALGRMYRTDRTNVSVGIVSAVGRIYNRALQTDAAVSPANYGGPLVDIEGKVLGILSPMSPVSEQTIAGVDWYDSGIGFAVPLDEWLAAYERLKQGNDLQVGYLGVGLIDGTPRETPAGVKSVVPAGPAADAGIEAGDVLTAIDGVPIATQVDLKFAITPRYAGDTVEATFERAGQEQSVQVTLATIAEVQEAAEAAAAEADKSNGDDSPDGDA